MTLAGRSDWIGAKGFPIALAVCGILWLGPYWAWTTPDYFRLSVVFVALAFLATFAIARTSLASKNILLAVFLLLLFLYFGAHKSSGGVFGVSSGWLVLIIFVLAHDETKRDAVYYFSVLFAITLVPAIVVFALSALGIEVPWHALSANRFDFDVLLGNEPGYYRQYLGSVIRSNQIFPVGRGVVFRLHGMYVEPGVVGTFAALLLVADGVRVRKRPHNAILLVGGLLSFSLAFYAIMFLYALLRRPLATLGLAGTLLALALSSPTFRDAPLIRLFFLNRLTFSGGQMLGDNRVTGLFAALYSDFWKADLGTRLFGSNYDVGLLVNTGTFSYKVIIFAYGLFGAALLIAFLIAATTSISRGRTAIILLLLLLASVYQRPDVLALPYLLALLGGAAQLQHQGEDSFAADPVTNREARRRL